MTAKAPTGGGTLPRPASRSSGSVRHAGEFPGEILELRFVQSIGFHVGHVGILSGSSFVRLL